jgi:putative membrane protein
LFELFEWAAAVWFGGDLGVAYLGTQGDPWDAQQDMFLALLGSVVAVTVLAALAAKKSKRTR